MWTSPQSQVGGGRTRDPVVAPGSDILVSVRVTQIIMTPATAQFSVSTMATGAVPEPVYPSLCPLVTTWAVNIIDSNCHRNTDPDVVFRSSLSLYVTIALGGK